MKDESLVQLEGVSKRFCRDFRRSLAYGLVDIGATLLPIHQDRSRLRRGEFWAVRDAGFSLRRGECLALLGRNGAGKTTLLRMLTGLIRPDTGRIQIAGAVGALIAIGAGGKEVLTGRENIYCMAALRGLSRGETEARMEEIIEFAELRDAIDAPLQSYSSGMRVRLNFAVATAMQPDVLFLDEVLAVGDAAFREKCYHRISELRRDAAVVFVSHNMEQVARICTRGLVLEAGSMAYLGPTEEAINQYEKLNTGAMAGDSDPAFLSLRPPVTAMSVAASGAESIVSGDELHISLNVQTAVPIPSARVKVIFYNSTGGFAGDGISTPLQGRLDAGTNLIHLTVPSVPLRNGIYRASLHLMDGNGNILAWLHKGFPIVVSGAYAGTVSDLALSVLVSLK